MRRISDIELHEMKKGFEHICVNILGIPKDAVSFKQESEDGISQEVKEHYEKLAEYYNTKGENK